MRLASPTMVAATTSHAAAPPSYPQSNEANNNSTSSTTAAPVPHFDSILRAAPAFDDDFDVEALADSPSSSTVSLSEQLDASEGSNLKRKLRPHIEHHTSLHAYLDANSLLEELIIETRERLHMDAGKVKSTSSKVTRLKADLEGLRLDSEKKGKVFWSPKKKREWRRRVAEVRSKCKGTC